MFVPAIPASQEMVELVRKYYHAIQTLAIQMLCAETCLAFGTLAHAELGTQEMDKRAKRYHSAIRTHVIEMRVAKI